MWATWALIIGAIALLIVVGRFPPKDSWLEVAEGCKDCECNAQAELACSFFNKMFVDELIELAWEITRASADETGLKWKDPKGWHREGFVFPTACPGLSNDEPVSVLGMLLACSEWGGREEKVKEALGLPLGTDTGKSFPTPK